MPRGILWVASRVVNPDALSSEKFCDWYENVSKRHNHNLLRHSFPSQRHIQEVLSLSGVPSAARYEALQPQPDTKAWSNEAPWLTVYEMRDIDYRESDDFKGLDGQSEPSQELLEGVFKNARFDTRFYEEVQVYEKENARQGMLL